MFQFCPYLFRNTPLFIFQLYLLDVSQMFFQHAAYDDAYQLSKQGKFHEKDLLTEAFECFR